VGADSGSLGTGVVTGKIPISTGSDGKTEATCGSLVTGVAGIVPVSTWSDGKAEAASGSLGAGVVPEGISTSGGGNDSGKVASGKTAPDPIEGDNSGSLEIGGMVEGVSSPTGVGIVTGNISGSLAAGGISEGSPVVLDAGDETEGTTRSTAASSLEEDSVVFTWGCGGLLSPSPPEGCAQSGTSDKSSAISSVSPKYDDVNGLTERESGICLISVFNLSCAGLFSGSRRRTRCRHATWRLMSVRVRLSSHQPRAEVGFCWR
jgi:hypothetical protein